MKERNRYAEFLHAGAGNMVEYLDIFYQYSSCRHRACLFYSDGKFLDDRSSSLFIFKDIMS